MKKFNSKFNIKIFEGTFAVCKINCLDDIKEILEHDSFLSLTVTDDEISVVIEEKLIPHDSDCEKGWKILKIDETLDFSLTGVISSITKILADANIPVFVISTFNTDYILIKSDNLERAVNVLKEICEMNPS